ncbi:DUF732 domain-containing protein [Mycobacterium sp. HUMS_1102779]|uniref:DUF732 domain-containing protein n=1 Tax=Mycobacterium sp. HUMS_1102779 TaxID=3383487 RepID=UPI003899D78A
MTIEDNQVPTESAPPPRPRRRRPSWTESAGSLVFAASIAIAAVLGLSAIGAYFLRDKTATSSGPQTVTVTPSHKTPSLSDGPDGEFLTALASYGIVDNGTEAIQQRFMEFGHHTCFSLLPPTPQPLETIVDNIMAAENKDVADGNPWSPKFTRADTENLTQAAIRTYCPEAQK